jgi:Zn-dependent protease
VLYALRYPFSFGVLIATFIVGVVVRGWVQRLVSGERQPKWVRANTRRRRSTWLKPSLDAYGCIAGLLGGVGWGMPVDISDPRHRSRGRRVAQLLVGPIVLGGLGVGLLVIFRAWTHQIEPVLPLQSAVTGTAFVARAHHNFQYSLPFDQVALFLAGVELLGMGVLAIIPIPPLDGGKLLFTLVPRSGAWQKARYRVDEENWGLVFLLVLALPVIFRKLVLVAALGHIVDPVVRSIL